MAKTDFLTADMTRRQFMKISGKSLAGLTLSASMLSLFGCSQQQVDSGAVATWALPQGLLVVNADLCTGCQRCEINCTLTNDGVCSSYISRVKIQRRLNLDGAGNGLLSGTDNCFVYFPDTCRQCEDPACGNACPQKAITTDDRGIRVVDTDKCIGCGACHDACPWHMHPGEPAHPQADPEPRPAHEGQEQAEVILQKHPYYSGAEAPTGVSAPLFSASYPLRQSLSATGWNSPSLAALDSPL